MRGVRGLRKGEGERKRLGGGMGVFAWNVSPFAVTARIRNKELYGNLPLFCQGKPSIPSFRLRA